MNIYRQKIEEIRQEFMGSIRAQEEQILSLKADNEALRKDAERYRFIRRNWCSDSAHDQDAALDAAMAKEAK